MNEKKSRPGEQNISNEIKPNLTQPETLKPEREIKFEETSAGRIFDNFLKSVAKKSPAIETAANIELKTKVFEQIEPRMIELANETAVGVEKRVMKIRLNPDDLGAVEVTMNKSDSGAVSAHFKTESETTRQILHENIEQLRNSLENSGLTVGNLEISCGSFASNGGERRENKPQHFGLTENQSVAAINSDGNSNKEDDQSRLVSLRA